MSVSKKRIFKISKILFGILLIGGLLGINYMAMQLASPAPSDIPSGAAKIIENPERFALSVRSVNCLDGKVPTLVVEPTSGVSVKGELVRKQLADRGVSLTAPGVIRGTVVILHGRTGRKENGLGIAERFCAAGLRCVLVDLPSHGESPVEQVKFGTTEWEQDLPFKVLTECAQRFHFSTENVALWGMSMGGSFANSAVADPKHGHTWSSLTIVCSFDSLQSVLEAQSHSSFLTDCVSKVCQSSGGADISQVSPALWIKDVTTPVLVVHGKEDQLIPSDNGKNLYHSYASERKRWIQVAEGNHSNILITPMPLYAEMAEWILQR